MTSNKQHDRSVAWVEALRADPGAITHPAQLTAASGLSSSQLRRFFEQRYHLRAEEFLLQQRLRAARRVLATTRYAIDEVAEGVGFKSRSVLQHHFTRRLRITPRAYRQLAQPGCAEFQLRLPTRPAFEQAWQHFGRDAKSHSERVQGGRCGLAIEQSGEVLEVSGLRRLGVLHCRLTAPAEIPPGAALTAHRLLLRVLGLAADPAPFERSCQGFAVGRRLLRRRGLVVPQTRDAFDGLIWVIAGQQVSLPVAFAQRRRLTAAFGRPGPGELIAPPSAKRVAELALSDFRRCGFSQRKAEYLSAIARSVATGELDLDRVGKLPADRLEQRLLAIRGLGIWSVRYLMMRVWGLADCVPLGDAALRRALQFFFTLDQRPDDPQTAELLRPFAPYRSLATFHFWDSLQDLG